MIILYIIFSPRIESVKNPWFSRTFLHFRPLSKTTNLRSKTTNLRNCTDKSTEIKQQKYGIKCSQSFKQQNYGGIDYDKSPPYSEKSPPLEKRQNYGEISLDFNTISIIFILPI